MPTFSCLVCGASFQRFPSFVTRYGPGKYCSRKCKHADMLGKRIEGGRYNGGRTTTRGYVYLRRPDHPFANTYGYVAEHRLVAEQMIGRLLLPTEIVHHKNGDRGDNRPDNLEVMTQTEHVRLHKLGESAA